MAQEKELDIYSVVRFVHRFLRKKKYTIIIFILASLTYSLINFYKQDKVYHVSATYISNYVGFDMVKRIFAPIEVAIYDKKADSLNIWLDVPLEGATSILNCELDEVLIPKQENGVTSAFMIRLSGTENIQGNNLGEKILDYMMRNPFASEVSKLRVQRLREYYVTINTQIGRLDSVQKLIPNYLIEQKKVASDLNLGSIYTEYVSLKKTHGETKELLEFSNEFKLVSYFENIERKSLVEAIFIGLFISLLLIVLLAIYHTILEVIRRARNTP